jgi:class 3 adenylate cyclase
LDKYIGDCVMSFWGAPTPDDKHALGCVRAAIDAQRAIYAVNTERAAENKRRQEENAKRIENGQEPLPLLPILALGAGINTGIATVGLMGSEAHIVNYTVFGREVNLASRLEGVSGRGRIFISDATYRDILRDDPTLAATFLELAPSIIKGFRDPVKMYEVPWKQTEVAATPNNTKTAAPNRPNR